MKHFKFENWKIGELENSIFDVRNRLFTTKFLIFFSAILDDPMVFVYLGAFAIGVSLIGLLVKRMISNI